MNTDTQLSTAQPNPFAMTTFEDVEKMAGYLSKANAYGLKEPAQFISLMLMAHEENITLGKLMQRTHVFPDGKLSNRADWLQAEFEEKAGKILWHVRTDDICIATFIRGTEVTEEQQTRAEQRMGLLLELDSATYAEQRDTEKERKISLKIGKLARAGEETVLRSSADAWDKGIAKDKTGQNLKTNWSTSPRSMLQWRCVSEGVKVVCPRILSGMPTDVEYNDVRILEENRKAQIISQPKPGDERAILDIIAQHDEELSDPSLSDTRRKTVLGLRQDLVCKLADMGIKAPVQPPTPQPTVNGEPAQTVEVLPPEQSQKKAPATRQRRPNAAQVQDAETTATSTPAATTTSATTTDQDENTPWQDFICHRGAAKSMFLDHTLGSIFEKATSEKRLEATMGGFAAMLSGSTDPYEMLLWKKANEAKAAWKPPQAQGTPAGAGSTETAQAAQTTPQQPAKPTSWRDFVIPGKSSYAGKRLGDIHVVEIAKIETEWLDTLKPEKMTLDARKIAVNVAMALSELLPPAATSEPAPAATEEEEPEHTSTLRKLIEQHSLNRNDFMKVCLANGYCSQTATRLEDFTEEEVIVLLNEQKQIAAEVKAVQP